MGNRFGAQDTTPDPTTGLSAKDIFWIKKSWADISKPADLQKNGVEIFVQLFTHFPHMQNYFKRFKDLEVSKLKDNPAFRAHAIGLMHYMTSYVQCLDDSETLVALVEKLVDSHIRRGITLKDFQDLASIFTAYLHLVLGVKKVTPEMEEAWGKLLAAQNAIFEARLKAHEK